MGNDDLFFDTTNYLWYDAFKAGRGGDFDYNDDGNNATPWLRCGAVVILFLRVSEC